MIDRQEARSDVARIDPAADRWLHTANRARAVRTVDDGNREGIQEHSLVDVLAGPNCSIVEGFEVFGVVEVLVQSDSLLQVLFVED
jgi:hypothetical protein